MQAVHSFKRFPSAIVSHTVEPSTVAENPIQAFCRLQIEQILSQFPDLGIRLVFHSPEHSKRQCLLYGREFWSVLDAEAQAFLASETWWIKNSIGRLIKVFTKSKPRFYACPISPTKPEYLLLGTPKLLTAKQKRLIENCANLLSHHLSMVRELYTQRQSYQQLEQKNNHIEHQVKSPIALVQIYTEMLLTTVSEQHSRSHLESIQASIQDISRHLKQLTVKQKPLRIAEHNLSELITESLKQLQPWLTEKDITVNYSRSLMLIDVDAWQFKQVLDNLISNAIHFSPISSQIDCHWEVTDQEIVIEISDHGVGLSESDVENLCTPFYSRRPGGTGLGLSIAQKIIHAHNGRLWAGNLPEGGAKFSVALPRYSPKLSIVPAI
ncbi:HAMP domain-containing sensor histidine kinase [Leptolyngbya boryana CZ1]|uniref:histidine kinase n=1 Tax=Leptolyngbya boryana CZ1 TaxID=3060204 RepID=A0AA97AMV2_LEPBY|nr:MULTISPECIES: HAMP domain-containing sensor histidine kinase [Leptolyngbya]MBD1858614.1 HAMP domain-containing histidine kinase [Leptolyngbya sp. FACHB-1624]WNZ44497.1 HAMP domain-containing sensor histidine kinase [Leptolyngbya boryana CZ1]